MHASSFVLSYSFFFFFCFVCFLFGAADCILSVAYHVNVPTSIYVPRSMLEKHEFVPKSKKYKYYIYIYTLTNRLLVSQRTPRPYPPIPPLYNARRNLRLHPPTRLHNPADLRDCEPSSFRLTQLTNPPPSQQTTSRLLTTQLTAIPPPPPPIAMFVAMVRHPPSM